MTSFGNGCFCKSAVADDFYYTTRQAGDTASAIEIAYELLVLPFERPPPDGQEWTVIQYTGDPIKDEILDDFADQAKVFADQMG
jgi:hypothetical protein